MSLLIVVITEQTFAEDGGNEKESQTNAPQIAICPRNNPDEGKNEEGGKEKSEEAKDRK